MRRLACVVVIALLGCTTGEAGDASVVLSEFQVSTATRMVAGPTELIVANQGEFAHSLVVSTTDGTVVGSTDVIAPGESAALQVDLEPGQYQFSCRIAVQIPDGSIVDHYSEGMMARVNVVGS